MKYHRLQLAESDISIGAQSAILQPLRTAKKYLVRGDIDNALRHLDQAWRLAPNQAASVGPIYGKLLLQQGLNYHAALAVLRRAALIDPRPETEALIITALLRSKRESAATEQLQSALRRFCVAQGSPLSQAAHSILANTAPALAGWVGVSPTFKLIGQVASAKSTAHVAVKTQDGTIVVEQSIKKSTGHYTNFTLSIPKQSRHQHLHAFVNDIPLIGNPLIIPADLDLDGRAAFEKGAISGWIRVGWTPDTDVTVLVKDEHGTEIRLQTKQDPTNFSRRAFSVRTRATSLKGGRFTLSVQLPNGSIQPLPDTPLLLREYALQNIQKPVVKGAFKFASERKWKTLPLTRLAVDVIIPVYWGLKDTLACIEAVLASTRHPGDVIVVNDHSPDPEITASLEDLARLGRITLLHNAENLGFAASVNRALALHDDRDAVVLNSDAIVHGDWLNRMRAAAYSAPNVGTVTPFTNDGSIASYPRNTESNYAQSDAAALHQIAASANDRMTVDLPVGVGFCLFLRRDCLKDVGNLDKTIFGTGYGEETDFCLRAKQRSWRHLLAADVFVLHAGGMSFGKRRAALLERSQRLLNIRHPGFDRNVEEFLETDPMRTTRRSFGEYSLRTSTKRFVLLVSLAPSGGVARFVTERCRTLQEQGFSTLILRPIKKGSTDCIIESNAAGAHDLLYAIPREFPILEQLLISLNIEHVEIQHFMGLNPKIIEAVQALSAPYDVYIHDYVWICPQITLIDHTGRYCGEPAIATCERCVKKIGSELGESLTVSALRKRSAKWLAKARQVIAPSADAAKRLSRYFPELAIQVEPPQPEPVPRKAITPSSDRIRVAMIGAIGQHKGYDQLLACAHDAVARRLPLEFTVIGYSQADNALSKTGRVFVTGEYAEIEVPHLLLREQPHVILLPSVWPETWSYALTHAIEAGLPIVAFDIGAIADRLRDMELGSLLPLETTTAELNNHLLKISSDHVSTVAMVKNDAEDANKAALSNNGKNKNMVKINSDEFGEEIKDSEITASVKILTIPTGLYLLSVKSGTPSVARTRGNLKLPALHVGIGPGILPNNVEFMPGSTMNGNWLSTAGDMLVVKVQGPSAVLVLTSARIPGSLELALRFEKLDARESSNVSHKPAPQDTEQQPAQSTQNLAAPIDKTTQGLRLQVGIHMRGRGDLKFADAPWAGRMGKGHWIESFSVTPLEIFSAQDIEYKGLTASGFESPWLSDGTACGTRGMSMPLVGFAVRLRTQPREAQYDCEYSAYFQSGVVVGPLRNGTPCRSTVPNDPLEGIQLRIIKRESGTPAKKPSPSKSKQPSSQIARKGPSFGKYRDEDDIAQTPRAKTTGKKSKPKAKPVTRQPSVKTRSSAKKSRH